MKKQSDIAAYANDFYIEITRRLDAGKFEIGVDGSIWLDISTWRWRGEARDTIVRLLQLNICRKAFVNCWTPVWLPRKTIDINLEGLR